MILAWKVAATNQDKMILAWNVAATNQSILALKNLYFLDIWQLKQTNINMSDTMVNIHLACPYEKRILPFLHKPLAPHEELRLMGQDGEYVSVHPQLASTLHCCSKFPIFIN